jgi:hypothetical protein
MPKAVIRGRQYCAKKIMICYAAISVQRRSIGEGRAFVVRLPVQMPIKGKMFIGNSKADWKTSSR